MLAEKSKAILLPLVDWKDLGIEAQIALNTHDFTDSLIWHYSQRVPFNNHWFEQNLERAYTFM